MDTHPSPLFFVPSPGTFLLASHVSFSGPCRPKKILVQVAGNVVAPRGVWTHNLTTAWITFKYVRGLSIYGSGKFDGQGFDWWTCRTRHLMAVQFCDGFRLSWVTFANSPAKHVTVFASQWVVIYGITVTAPWDSPNTDGILIAQSKHVQLMASSFAAGDDCVAIGTGSYDVNVSKITCGPGHGISIGSLGMGGTRAEVENVRVTDCHISHTMFGARIKTWSGGSGFARGILFEHITFRAVQYPIFIDQYYCGSAIGCPNKTSNVEVRNVQFVGLVGTSTSDRPIRLECSKNVPCRNILLDHVVIASTVQGKPASSSCYNAQGYSRDP
ncbi:hypothetical protein Taro_015557, partial [Colocasia esculenta]|nr:hypothetical protein [Colocasia esculenta]